MPDEFTCWMEFDLDDPFAVLPGNDELVRVMYHNGHIECAYAWEIDWDEVKEYQLEVLS